MTNCFSKLKFYVNFYRKPIQHTQREFASFFYGKISLSSNLQHKVVFDFSVQHFLSDQIISKDYNGKIYYEILLTMTDNNVVNQQGWMFFENIFIFR